MLNMRKLLLIPLLLLIVLPLSLGATLHGAIYDLELNQLDNVLIEINSQPIQKFLAKEGEYNFSLEQGKYTLKAEQVDSFLSTEEEISIEGEGDFTYDLFLIEDLNIDLLEELNTEIDTLEENNPSYAAIAIIFLVLLAIVMIKKKKEPEEIDDLVEKVFSVIKEEKRITQKDLRKKFPYSEAKISLVITELEHKGKIEKIKKGRTNIIIIK